MRQQSPIATFFLTFLVPFYSLYWLVLNKGQMNAHGADIPTAWLILIPLVNLWWLYKFAVGVEHVTGGKMSAVIGFLLMFLLGAIGYAIIQDSFNKVSSAGAPVAPAGQAPQFAQASPSFANGDAVAQAPVSNPESIVAATPAPQPTLNDIQPPQTPPSNPTNV